MCPSISATEPNKNMWMLSPDQVLRMTNIILTCTEAHLHKDRGLFLNFFIPERLTETKDELWNYFLQVL